MVVVNSPLPLTAPCRPTNAVLVFSPASWARMALLSTKSFSPLSAMSASCEASCAQYTVPLPVTLIMLKPSPVTLRLMAPSRLSPARIAFSNFMAPTYATLEPAMAITFSLVSVTSSRRSELMRNVDTGSLEESMGLTGGEMAGRGY